MPNNYDSLDLSFSWNGDYSIGHDGDLEDTTNDYLRSLKEQIHDLAASEFNDWEIYKKRGATLSDFIGEGNTKLTANRIHDRVRLSLVTAGLVSEEDLKITVVPVHIHKILIILNIHAVPTPLNQLTNSGGISVQLVFDFLEQGVFFLDKQLLPPNS